MIEKPLDLYCIIKPDTVRYMDLHLLQLWRVIRKVVYFVEVYRPLRACKYGVMKMNGFSEVTGEKRDILHLGHGTLP